MSFDLILISIITVALISVCVHTLNYRRGEQHHLFDSSSPLPIETPSRFDNNNTIITDVMTRFILLLLFSFYISLFHLVNTISLL